jgi:hypothetical protein
MKLVHLPLTLAVLLSLGSGLVGAQTAVAVTNGPLTRSEVKMERDEFIRTHHYNGHNDEWVLNADVEAPGGMKTRAEVKAERDTFLANNRWVDKDSDWVPIKPGPRVMSSLTRAQVRAETNQFSLTHTWDANKGVWVRDPAKHL